MPFRFAYSKKGKGATKPKKLKNLRKTWEGTDGRNGISQKALHIEGGKTPWERAGKKGGGGGETGGRSAPDYCFFHVQKNSNRETL